MIIDKVAVPKFYVFTDNPDWVRENFKDIEYTLVEGNPASGWGSHFDMQLMSVCKHNIISNSTYSWWSAFLNAHPQKIVVDQRCGLIRIAVQNLLLKEFCAKTG